MSIITPLILILAYFIVGCIIYAPYTYLANGNMENFTLPGVVIAPAVALILFMVHVAEQTLSRRKSHRTRMLGDWYFWGLLTYFCLPILLNGASLLLNSMGFATTGHYIFKFRYATFLGVPVAIVIFAIVAGFVGSIWEKFKGEKPPSSQPPSNIGSGGRQPIVKKTEGDIDPNTFQVVIV